jgi:hypothetical protein
VRLVIERQSTVLEWNPNNDSGGRQMTDVRKMKAKVEAAIKKADPKTMTGTFYDGASDRLFVTIVKGSKKIFVALRGKDFGNGDSTKLDLAIADGLRRLQETPIG